jgi:hypothetical protein
LIRLLDIEPSAPNRLPAASGQANTATAGSTIKSICLGYCAGTLQNSGAAAVTGSRSHGEWQRTLLDCPVQCRERRMAQQKNTPETLATRPHYAAVMAAIYARQPP